MSDTFSKVEVITGVARRRRFSTDLKLAVVAETLQPGMSVNYIARPHGLSPRLVYLWRPLTRVGGGVGTAARPQDHGGRDPQGGARSCTGKKTDLAVALAASGRYSVKTVSTTLGVARSNVVE